MVPSDTYIVMAVF